MRYSANLNVIIKAIEKAASHMSRDFNELEHLQANPASANKFANACYNRVKQVLAEDLLKFRPDYNLIFSDGQKLIKDKNAEYSFVIFPIDGFDNFARSNPDFTIAIALEHFDAATGKRESISVAISKIFGGEIYYCEKGYGAYMSSRRIRVSKRLGSETLLVAGDDQKLIAEKMADKKFSTRSYGCRTLELAYLASARLESVLFSGKNSELTKPFLLLVREAGGKTIEEEQFILASN
jgi:myo-inositol-1(or 4)-monophosphatase